MKLVWNIFCSFGWIIAAIIAVHDWWAGGVTQFSTMMVSTCGAGYILLDSWLGDDRQT
jgi:hypothetical protein